MSRSHDSTGAPEINANRSMTTQPPTDAARELLPVIQADREAVASYAKIGDGWSASVRAGQCDDHPLVQAFARHRLAECERCAKVVEVDPIAARHVRDRIATAIRETNDAARVTQEEFCTRFKARMLERAGPTFDDGDSIADYADETAPSYFEEPWQRDMGPEACADADMSYWGE